MISQKKALRVSLVVVTLVVLLGLGVNAAASDIQSRLPMPMGAPPGAVHRLPSNLPGATGGSFVQVDRISSIALDTAKAREGLDSQVKDVVLTTHGRLVQEGVFGQSYSVGDTREVYLVTVTGDFTFRRGPEGEQPVRASFISIEIDATTGDVLAVGTSKVAQDAEVLDILRGKR